MFICASVKGKVAIVAQRAPNYKASRSAINRHVVPFAA
jgi:hypothetical protein